mmetsp:Transcript_47075/g.75643  ORF Transcript_47075/g.75643 Transcript_47075/m.75643 type:complete len:212 (+) Transcript_47075:177-812(+)
MGTNNSAQRPIVHLGGTNNAGKTAFLIRLGLSKFNEEYKGEIVDSITTTSTVGTNREEMTLKGVRVAMVERSGGLKAYGLYRYINDPNTPKMLVYIVDSKTPSPNEKNLMTNTKLLFRYIVGDETISCGADKNLVPCDLSADVPILVLANKQDLEGGFTASQVADHLGLREYMASKFPGREWACLPLSLKTGEGLDGVVNWISSHVGRKTR